MLFRNKRIKEATTAVVLASLLWLTGGGEAWAQSELAEKDPEAFLARAAADPRLPLTPEQRDTLRAAAETRNGAAVVARAAADPRLELSAEQRAVARRLADRSTAAPPPEVVRAGQHSERRTAADLADLGVEIAALAAAPAPGQKAALRSLDRSALTALEARLETAHASALADFRATGLRLRRAGLAQEKLDLHAGAEADYRRSFEEVRADLRAALAETDVARAQAALAAAAEKLSGTTDHRPHIAYDPQRMPHRGVEPVYREPGSGIETGEARRSDEPPVRSFDAVSAPLESVVTSKAAPTPADLAPTIDVQITPEIQALAASLGNQPLAIFDWVRNHIEFYPTWGSVQGSQMTLDSLRGNAFDQASLLLALLRAAGVPSRYVTGTIQVPSAAVQNWVGGAETPGVAQQILGIGGIDNVGLLVGGSVAFIRLDHVWVEAYIDNIPSRGAVQVSGDTWLPMDPSFKLHAFTPLGDVFTAVPITDFVENDPLPFTVDETLGKITDLDTELFDQQIIDWISASDAYMVDSGFGAADREAVFNEVVGGQSIIAETSTVFPASLPYAVVARDGALSALPANLRHSVTLRGFNSSIDRAFGNASFSTSISLPELNTRRLGIRFPPSTSADAAVIDNAIAGGAASLPVYLINVTPRVELDGTVIATGGSLRMGSAFFVDVVLRSPEGSKTVPYQVVAGDEIVAGITGNGFAPSAIEKRFNAHPVDNAPEYFHQVQMHYWAESDQLGAIAARGLGVHPLRLPSVGFFSSPLTVSYFFGTPRTGVYQGRSMDVQQSLVGGASVQAGAVAQWVKQSGHYGSYLEGSVFEQLASGAGPEPVAAGISSLHLISYAAGRGVPIYYITQANRAAVMPLLQLSSAVKADINSAVIQGQTALVPESNIDLGAWRGVGYILQDETTGAGAYLISGGAAGGGLLDCLERLVPSWDQLLQFLLFLLIFLVILGLIIGATAGSGGALAPAGAAAAVFFFFLLFGRGGSPTTAPTTA